MGSIRTVRVLMIIFVALHALMAFGAIGVFVRMAPAIEQIIARNLRTQEDCELMLRNLIEAENGTEQHSAEQSFMGALRSARENITEPGEPEALAAISEHMRAAFDGDRDAKSQLLAAISSLSRLNRNAMRNADAQARRLGVGGAWGMVFMAALLFALAMMIVRSISRQVTLPLEELHSVMEMRRSGDTQRRCSLAGTSQDVRLVFDEVNRLLDVEQRAMDSYSRRLGKT
ncbi:MAG: hypothetical protein CSA62_10760 [Planctomycetota bacterium]|nr:MAG: hypothetical protein CSA62_10760 [Planctomycetota bacterium]